MRVLLTGATGFIGSQILPLLQSAGHEVVGLARSEKSAQALLAAGALVHRGTLEAPESLLEAALGVDAIIHTAFDHDFSHFVANCEKDSRVIHALGSALKGSSRPFIITSGTGMGDAQDGRPALESVFNANNPNPRVASELAGNALLAQGVDVRVVRLPQVHDTTRQGLISPYIEISAAQGTVAVVGDGLNRWPAAHVSDVAKLYLLVLEKGEKGGRYHAVAEPAIRAIDIARTVSQKLGLPQSMLSVEEAAAHFGWFALFADKDLQASGRWTQEKLGWEPCGPGLIDDLLNMDYSHLR